MKITVSIDNDVAAALDELYDRRHGTMEEIVNDLLRRGLRELGANQQQRKPFRTASVDCGKPLLDNVDNIAEILEIIEGPRYK